MNLVVDYGNSAAKVGIFDQRNLIEKYILTTANELKTFLSTATSENIIVSSVSQDSREILAWATAAKNKFILTYKMK